MVCSSGRRARNQTHQSNLRDRCCQQYFSKAAVPLSSRRTESAGLHAALTVTLPSETAAPKADQALPRVEAWGGLAKGFLARMVSACHCTGSTGNATRRRNRVRPRRIGGARRRAAAKHSPRARCAPARRFLLRCTAAALVGHHDCELGMTARPPRTPETRSREPDSGGARRVRLWGSDALCAPPYRLRLSMRLACDCIRRFSRLSPTLAFLAPVVAQDAQAGRGPWRHRILDWRYRQSVSNNTQHWKERKDVQPTPYPPRTHACDSSTCLDERDESCKRRNPRGFG